MEKDNFMEEKNTNQTENIVALLHGRKNIYKHLSFLFNNTKKDIIFSVENETEDQTKITNLINKAKRKFPKYNHRIQQVRFLLQNCYYNKNRIKEADQKHQDGFEKFSKEKALDLMYVFC